MGDEWVCKDCNYATDEKQNNDECPLCKVPMVNIGEVDDDLKLSKTKDSDTYDDDEFDTPIDESLDDDYVDEEDSAKKAKK